MELEKVSNIDNLYWLTTGRREELGTKNKTPGRTFYGERRTWVNGCELRIWNPYRSKIAAAIHRRAPISIRKTDEILYLGAATGTTLSHISDINTEGITYAVEVSPTSASKLLTLCEARENIIPMLEDAEKPRDYQGIIGEVDIIYQDIAQRNQAEIALKNTELFLKEKGELILTIKARSIDVSSNPRDVLRRELERLEERVMISHIKSLKPYHRDHYITIARVKD